jgi:hypothetical protein
MASRAIRSMLSAIDRLAVSGDSFNEVNAAVTVDAVARRAISSTQMCALAARLSDGRASREDLRMADRLIIHLVDRLPPDSSIDLPE